MKDKINILPLVDLMMVLLMFFLLNVKNMSETSSIKVKLPTLEKRGSAEPNSDIQELIISKEKLFCVKQNCTDRLSQLFIDLDVNKNIYVQIDKSLSAEFLLNVLDLLGREGHQNLEFRVNEN